MKKLFKSITEFVGTITIVVALAVTGLFIAGEMSIESITLYMAEKNDPESLFDISKSLLYDTDYYVHHAIGVSMSTDNTCRIFFNVKRTLNDTEELKVGNVYGFRDDQERHISHRLKRIEFDEELGEDLYYFQGDNPITNSNEDDPVKRDAVRNEEVSIIKSLVQPHNQDDCYKQDIQREDYFDFISGRKLITDLK